ncbi:MAG: hypothetical protein ABIB47_06240 [Candidatus Woesearchaeota archaeon]
MVCANVLLSLAAILIFLSVVWPGFGNMQWIVGISALVILIVAWTGCKCKYCGKK